MRDVGLASRIRAKGVRVIETAGCQTRGSSTFSPKGSVNHHTAGSPKGTISSYSTVLYGRPGLSGPLCNVLQSREADPTQDIAYIIACGKANHGGVGHWGSLSGNAYMHGLEIEHTGTGTVPQARLEIAARIHAAFLEAPGSSRNAQNTCQHFEYATPKGRKPDFRELSPFTADSFRARVQYWIGRTANGVVVNPGQPPVYVPPVLELNDTGIPVKQLQQYLNQILKSTIAVDGHFGPATYHLVVTFQKNSGLSPDGVVGPATWAAISKAITPVQTPKPVIEDQEMLIIAPVNTAGRFLLHAGKLVGINSPTDLTSFMNAGVKVAGVSASEWVTLQKAFPVVIGS